MILELGRAGGSEHGLPSILELVRSVYGEHDRSVFLEHGRSVVLEHGRSVVLEHGRSVIVEQVRSVCCIRYDGGD